MVHTFRSAFPNKLIFHAIIQILKLITQKIMYAVLNGLMLN